MYVPKRATRLLPDSKDKINSYPRYEGGFPGSKLGHNNNNNNNNIPMDEDHVMHLCFLFGPSRHGVMWLQQYLAEHPQNVSVMGKTRVDILVESMK